MGALVDGVWVDGRYELLSLAGRGGMAEVFRARAHGGRKTGQIVALKRMVSSLVLDAEARRMFHDEARTTAMFSHPNLVRLHDCGHDPKGPWLALEWVDGGSARDLVTEAREPLSVALVSVIALDVLAALDGMHRGRTDEGRVGCLPTVHCDVSLSNVLLTRDGHAKLADLGLARSIAHPRRDVSGTVRGKLGYLPPEVLAGRPHGVPGDLYGVACLFWEALTGASLFSDLPTGPRLRALVAAPRPSIRALRPDVGRELARVIDGALALEPSLRPGSAREMARALHDVVSLAGLRAARAEVIDRIATRSPRVALPVRHRIADTLDAPTVPAPAPFVVERVRPAAMAP